MEAKSGGLGHYRKWAGVGPEPTYSQNGRSAQSDDFAGRNNYNSSNTSEMMKLQMRMVQARQQNVIAHQRVAAHILRGENQGDTRYDDDSYSGTQRRSSDYNRDPDMRRRSSGSMRESLQNNYPDQYNNNSMQNNGMKSNSLNNTYTNNRDRPNRNTGQSDYRRDNNRANYGVDLENSDYDDENQDMNLYQRSLSGDRNEERINRNDERIETRNRSTDRREMERDNSGALSPTRQTSQQPLQTQTQTQQQQLQQQQQQQQLQRQQSVPAPVSPVTPVLTPTPTPVSPTQKPIAEAVRKQSTAPPPPIIFIPPKPNPHLEELSVLALTISKIVDANVLILGETNEIRKVKEYEKSEEAVIGRRTKLRELLAIRHHESVVRLPMWKHKILGDFDPPEETVLKGKELFHVRNK